MGGGATGVGPTVRDASGAGATDEGAPGEGTAGGRAIGGGALVEGALGGLATGNGVTGVGELRAGCDAAEGGCPTKGFNGRSSRASFGSSKPSSGPVCIGGRPATAVAFHEVGSSTNAADTVTTHANIRFRPTGTICFSSDPANY